MKAKELLDLLDKQWANTKDIQKIGGIGEAKAIKIKKQIKDELINNKNYYLPNERTVPMCEVVKFFKIDINYLKRIERSEKQ